MMLDSALAMRKKGAVAGIMVGCESEVPTGHLVMRRARQIRDKLADTVTAFVKEKRCHLV
jgi:hypothetical protein